jgi:ABC-type multidrug transport system fused ATPase/permease subunit
MKHLLVFLKDYKKETVLGPLFKLLEASFELIVPLVMASIIDVGIANTNRPYIYKMCGVLVLLALVGLVSAVTAQYFAAKAAVGFSTKLRYALFEHIGELSFTEMDHVGTSTLITRMTSDVNQVQSGVNMTLRLFLRSPFIVFGAMIMAFTVDVKAALVFVVTIPLLSIVVFGVMLLCMPRFKKVQQGLDAILGRTRENLAGARVIRAFNKEEEEVASFGEENERLTNMQLLVGRISALTNPLTYIIINAAIIAVIWIGGNRVYGGYITQGAVVALVNYMSQILVELVKLANLIVNITKSLACANRIAEVLALESTLKEPETDGAACAGRSDSPDSDAQGSAAAGIAQSSADSRTDSAAGDQVPAAGDDGIRVRFDHVSMTYAGASEEALKDIDFQAKAGQTIGIIGGTGSGKSSLVHLIPRFYDVSAGAVYVDGKDVRDYSITALRDKVGMVMQKAVLFSGTIAENLRWGNENATEEEMWHALDIAQATDVVKSKKDGLDSRIEEGGKNLSGGQKQRLTIARAVVKDPDILILDDSASALDFATDAKLRAALRRLQEEGSMTVFIVSQRTSSIRFADQIIVLDDGIAVGIGTHDELLQNCEIYREIYDSQFKKEGGSHAE